MNRLQPIASVVAVALTTGCAHDPEGHQIRTGNVRFDAQSVTSSGGYTAMLNSDGTWGTLRYERVGDQIRGQFGGAAGDYGYVQVDQLPKSGSRPPIAAAPVHVAWSSQRRTASSCRAGP